MSVLDEVGILLETSTVNAKYDCLLKCSSNSACKMSSFKVNQCKLLSKVKYSVQLSPTTSDPCLFQKYIPDYSAINANLVHWWPFNNDVKDIVDGADLYGGSSSTGKSFTTDRLNQPNSAIYLNLAYYQMPARKYVAGDYTLSFWLKLHSFQQWAFFMHLGLSTNVYSIYPGYFVNNAALFRISTDLYRTPGIFITQANGATNDLRLSVNNLQLNKWHHVAFTQSGSIGAIYIDGQKTLQGACNPPTNVVRDFNEFGSDHAYGARPDAEFDDVKIYNRSLTQDEIRKVLNSYY
jgi:hypothetical protein